MTKDTIAEQRLEIMIKIAHQFLQALIIYCEVNHKKGITADEITATRGVNFDMELIEPLGIRKPELAGFMHDGVVGIASMLINVMKDTKATHIPVSVLMDFEKRWNWKEIFKSVIGDKK